MSLRQTFVLALAVVVLTASVFVRFISNLEATFEAGVTCYYTSETDGTLYRTCWYDCQGEAVAHMVKMTELCPLTIEVER